VTSCGQVRWDDVRCLRTEHANRLGGSCCGALRGDVRCCRRGRIFRGADESVLAATSCGQVRWDDVRCLRMEHANRLSGSCCGALRGDVRCCRRGRTFRGAEESVSAATGCGWVTLRRRVRTFGWVRGSRHSASCYGASHGDMGRRGWRTRSFGAAGVCPTRRSEVRCVARWRTRTCLRVGRRRLVEPRCRVTRGDARRSLSERHPSGQRAR
jgi:hypothetical protein